MDIKKTPVLVPHIQTKHVSASTTVTSNRGRTKQLKKCVPWIKLGMALYP